MKVTIYTTTYCGFCRRAEALLERRQISYQKIDVTHDADAREELVERANGRRTVPVIFFGDRAIGGYEELANLDAAGGLAAMVNPANDTTKTTAATDPGGG